MDAAYWVGIGSFFIESLKVLVAPAAALVGALGGSAYANRRSAEREREQRAESRRDASRGLMVELLHSGNAWALQLQYSNLSTILDSLGAGSSKNHPQASEAPSELATLRSRLEMAFTDILLRVEDPNLRAVIEHCRAEMDRSKVVTGAIATKVREKDSDLAAEMKSVFAYVREFRAELRTMEQAAIPYFAAPIQ